MNDRVKCSNASCIACYGGVWMGIYPPVCAEELKMIFPNLAKRKFPEETITIKKALWDEMLECKKKIDDLRRFKSIAENSIERLYSYMQDVLFRLESLENKINY